MRTQEVSLVDVAANMRRFVVMKRAERAEKNPMANPVAKAGSEKDLGTTPEDTATVQPYDPTAHGSEGDLGNDPKATARIQETAPGPNGSEGDLGTDPDTTGDVQEYAKGPGDGAPGPSDGDQPVPQIALPGEVKQAMLDGLAMVLENMTTLAEMVNQATEDDSAQVPPELAQAFEAADQVFDGLMNQYGIPDPDQGQAQPAAAAPAPAAPAQGAESKCMKCGTPFAEMQQFCANCGGPLAAATAAAPAVQQDAQKIASIAAIKSAQADVLKSAGLVKTSKIGKKMANSRLKMLKQSYDILSGLLKELMDENPENAAQVQAAFPPKPGAPAAAPAPAAPAAPAAHAPPPAPPKPAAAPAPAAPAAAAPPAAPKAPPPAPPKPAAAPAPAAAAPPAAPKAPPPAPPKKQPPPPQPAQKSATDARIDQVLGAMEKLFQNQTALQSTVTQLAKAAGVSNALPPSETHITPPTPVIWEGDMAAAVARRNSTKTSAVANGAK